MTAPSFSYVSLETDRGRLLSEESFPERGPVTEKVLAGLPGVFNEMLPEKSGICASASKAEQRKSMAIETVLKGATIMRLLNTAKEHKENHIE